MDATVADVHPAQARRRLRRMRSAQRQRLLLQPPDGISHPPAGSAWREAGGPSSRWGPLAALTLSLLLHALGVTALVGVGSTPSPSKPVALLWVAPASVAGETTAGATPIAPSSPPTPTRPVRRPRRSDPVSRARPAPAPAEPVPARPNETGAGISEPVPLRAGDSPGAAVGGAVAVAGPSAAAPVSSQTAVRRVRGGYQQRPTYPARALRLGLEGTTLLRVRVSAEGRVREAVVERSAGEEEFDRSASEAVRRWRFEAAREGDPPDDVWVLVPIQFEIRERTR